MEKTKNGETRQTSKKKESASLQPTKTKKQKNRLNNKKSSLKKKIDKKNAEPHESVHLPPTSSLKNASRFHSYFTQERKKLLKKIVLYTTIALVSLFALLFIFNTTIQLNFLLKGDVSIATTPSQITLLTEKRTSEPISINITAKNQIFCKASCSYEFRDLSHNELLSQHNFSATGITAISFEEVITPPAKGTGQLAFELVATCQNKKTLLCKTDGEKKLSSTFISLGYELSQEERLFVSSLEENLTSFLNNLSMIDEDLQYLEEELRILRPYLHENNLDFPLRRTVQRDLLLINSSQTVRQLWDEEEYDLLSENLSLAFLQLQEVTNETLALQQLLEENKHAYNETVTRINTLYTELPVIHNISHLRAVLHESTYKQKERAYISSYLLVLDQYDDLSASYASIQSNADALSRTLTNDAQSLRVNVIDLINMGIGLLRAEQNLTLSSLNVSANVNDSSFIFPLLLYNQSGNVFTLFAEVCLSLQQFTNVSSSTAAYLSSFCSYTPPKPTNLSGLEPNLPDLPTTDLFTPLFRVTTTIAHHQPICCIFGECTVCCEAEACYDDPATYPIILVHGHAFSRSSDIEYSLEGFSKIRRKLLSEGFLDGGTVFPTEHVSQENRGSLGRFGKPVIFGTTFYVDAYNENGSVVRFPSKNESIETYAARLQQTIDIVKAKTNSNKVNIIAFSMGGLVAREYLREYGEDDVHRLILLGTPNKGVSGAIEGFCPVTGSRTECVQMSANSEFIARLNNINNRPTTVRPYVIYGTGCDMQGEDGDGIVVAASAQLPYTLNFQISGTCGVKKLHEELRNIDKYPQVYTTIKNILNG
ncbi:MAG: alpha/beta fold hydrolase [Candidatus Woesearchaeota archaeon]|nr:MAG: alpha/beta fold hydrolase [Candidatus Woesearchaeota archaeon]